MARILAMPGSPEVQAVPALPRWLQWTRESKGLVCVTFVKLEHCVINDNEQSCLADLPHLERLYLAAAAVISDESLEHLRGLTSLRRLSLWNTQVTDRGIECLRGLRNLEAIDLQGTAVTEAALESLQQLPNLRELPQEIELSDLGLKRLREFPHAKDLRLPWLYARQITDRGMADLGALGGVESLKIDESQLSDAGLEHLRQLGKLKSLDIEGTPCTPQGLLVLSKLSQVRELHLGSLPGVSFGDIARVWGQRMEKLTLLPAPENGYGCSISGNGKGLSLEVSVPIADADLAELKHFSNAKSLTLRHFSGAGLAHLKNLPQLEELSIHTALDDSSLASLSHLPRLRSLDIAHDYLFPCRLSDAGFSPLHIMRQLQWLRFQYLPLRDEQLSFLAGMTKLNSLAVCNDPVVTGSFLVHLRNLPALERLVLVDCPSVVDGSLIHLEGIKTLKSIFLEHTDVTNAGLPHLHGLTALSDVDLLGSKVTDSGRAKLRIKLPSAHVF